MSVVQRCPNCGTTQSTEGECSACHGAQVRHFCTNHEPGLWLDGRTCRACDARLEVARSAAAPRALPAAPADLARGGGERPRSVEPGDVEIGPARRAPWSSIFTGPALARFLPTEVAPGSEAMPIGRALGGCLVRLLVIAVVLLIAVVAALYVLGRALT